MTREEVGNIKIGDIIKISDSEHEHHGLRVNSYEVTDINNKVIFWKQDFIKDNKCICTTHSGSFKEWLIDGYTHK